MKQTYFSLCLLLVLGISTISAQDSLSFKPSGYVIARGFLDYSTGFGKVNNQKGFDIKRAFLGYNYDISPSLSARVIIDGAAGKTSSNSIGIHVRNVMVTWKDKGFTINGGLTNLMQFSIQEKYWMHRYLIESFQDLNKMAPSVDLGATAQYAFNPFVSADFSITNGEGYKNVKKDNNMRYAAGLNVYPTKNTILRVYTDVYNDDEALRDALPLNIAEGSAASYKDQYTLSLFAGYQDKVISAGAEYNRVYNKGFVENKDYYGYSFYSSAKVAPKWRAFARYDLMDSSAPSYFVTPWNDLDGQLIIVGAEFQPTKQLKIAPNFRNINADRAEAQQYLFVNVEVNL